MTEQEKLMAYEQAKYEFCKKQPEATNEEYEAFIVSLCERLGV